MQILTPVANPPGTIFQSVEARMRNCYQVRVDVLTVQLFHSTSTECQCSDPVSANCKKSLRITSHDHSTTYFDVVTTREAPNGGLRSSQRLGKVNAHAIFSPSECRREQRKHPEEDCLARSLCAVDYDAENVLLISCRFNRGEFEGEFFQDLVIPWIVCEAYVMPWVDFRETVTVPVKLSDLA